MNLSAQLSLFRRRWILLLLCVLAGLAGGIYRGATTDKSYTATSRSLVNIPSAGGIQEALQGAQLSGNLLATYAQVAESQQVAERVLNSLNLPEDVEELQGKLTATTEVDTYIIKIAVTDADPQRAADIANAAATSLSETVRVLEAGKASRIQVQVLDRARPPLTPTAPKPRTDAVLGLLLGVFAGVGLVLLLEALDRTVKTQEQATRAGSAPVLGSLPRRRGRLPLLAGEEHRTTSEAEAIRAIRTAIRFLDPDQPLRTLLVSSPGAGEGKTSLTGNLALALAESGERVVVVDADLRRASLSDYFGLERAVGVSNVVVHRATLDDALQVWREGLTVLPGGELPPNPAELLGSQAMSDLISQLQERFDVVLIDAPPVLPVTDAVVLSTQVDAVILLARYGKTSRASLTESVRRLDGVGAHVGGVVLNGIPRRESASYYAPYSAQVGT